MREQGRRTARGAAEPEGICNGCNFDIVVLAQFLAAHGLRNGRRHCDMKLHRRCM